MWQNLLFGLDPNQLIDSTITRNDSAANGAAVGFPNTGAVPPNEAWIIHHLHVVQGGGAVTARKVDLIVTGPVLTDGVVLQTRNTLPAIEELYFWRPLLLPPGFALLAQRNGFDAGSTIIITVWWNRVSLPAKRALDKTRSASPRRIDEIFMLTEG